MWDDVAGLGVDANSEKKPDKDEEKLFFMAFRIPALAPNESRTDCFARVRGWGLGFVW